MEIGEQIKRLRAGRQLSQEELADRVFVTRQTVSNWETGKTYPDLNSLLLLGEIFQISLDQLVKGDVQTMKEEIRQEDIRRFRRAGWLLWILMGATVLSSGPLTMWLGPWALLPWGLLASGMLAAAWHAERLKKRNGIHTYREIVAFLEGRRLDEMDALREEGKRPYQRILLAAASGLVALAVFCLSVMLLMR